MALDLADLAPFREEFLWRGITYALVDPSAGAAKRRKVASMRAGRANFDPDNPKKVSFSDVDVAVLAEAESQYLCDCLRKVVKQRDNSVKDVPLTMPELEEFPEILAERLQSRLSELAPSEGQKREVGVPTSTIVEEANGQGIPTQ